MKAASLKEFGSKFMFRGNRDFGRYEVRQEERRKQENKRNQRRVVVENKRNVEFA